MRQRAAQTANAAAPGQAERRLAGQVALGRSQALEAIQPLIHSQASVTLVPLASVRVQLHHPWESVVPCSRQQPTGLRPTASDKLSGLGTPAPTNLKAKHDKPTAAPARKFWIRPGFGTFSETQSCPICPSGAATVSAWHASCGEGRHKCGVNGKLHTAPQGQAVRDDSKDARDPLKFLILENASDNKALCVNNLVLKWKTSRQLQTPAAMAATRSSWRRQLKPRQAVPLAAAGGAVAMEGGAGMHFDRYRGVRVGEASTPGPPRLHDQQERALEALARVGIGPAHNGGVAHIASESFFDCEQPDNLVRSADDQSDHTAPGMTPPPSEDDTPGAADRQAVCEATLLDTPPETARSWLYVPLLLHAAGRLTDHAAQVWLAHPSGGARWRRAAESLAAAPPVALSELVAAVHAVGLAEGSTDVDVACICSRLGILASSAIPLRDAVAVMATDGDYIPALAQSALLQTYCSTTLTNDIVALADVFRPGVLFPREVLYLELHAVQARLCAGVVTSAGQDKACVARAEQLPCTLGESQLRQGLEAAYVGLKAAAELGPLLANVFVRENFAKPDKTTCGAEPPTYAHTVLICESVSGAHAGHERGAPQATRLLMSKAEAEPLQNEFTFFA
ncbi:hypothetical protein AK812_SmicGene44096 [Symbiodinium microadriaticum]|uniref:Uncharacterized protein n=1 Tax=Symbiodinium microadriaticum TaxID=2951 RepID=A0A1Q9BZB7_SYMMI|nr:hypothetical protein AK812_SmicGene44096 [Symbiodinium microadriaticum]